MIPPDIDASWTSAKGEESDELRQADGLPVYRYWIERRWSDAPAYAL